jgi:TPR repeat protein
MAIKYNVKYLFLFVVAYFSLWFWSFNLVSLDWFYGPIPYLSLLQYLPGVGIFSVLFYVQSGEPRQLRVYDLLLAIIILSFIIFLRKAYIAAAIVVGTYVLVNVVVMLVQRCKKSVLKSDQVTQPVAFYPASVWHFCFMYFYTFGLYKVFWWYRNWSYVKQVKGKNISVWMRSLFPIFFYRRFLNEINESCDAQGVAGVKAVYELTDFYIYGVVSFFAFGLFAYFYVIFLQRFSPFWFTQAYKLIFLLVMLIVFIVPLRAIKRLNQAQGAVLPVKSYLLSTVIFILLGGAVWVQLGEMAYFANLSEANRVERYIGVGDMQSAFREAQVPMQQGDKKAQYMLGVMYMTGRGVGRDTTVGLRLLEASAQQGYVEAQKDLGMFYRDDAAGDKKDYQKSVYWYEKALAQGSAYAASDLAWMYERGLGVKKDLKKSHELDRYAAEHDDYVGMYNVGLHAAQAGRYKEAAMWYQKSLDKEVTICAAYDLGVLYAKGQGVKRNKAEARKLISLSGLMALLNYREELFPSGVEIKLEGMSKKQFEQLPMDFADYELYKLKNKPGADKFSVQTKQVDAAVLKKIDEECWR